MSNAARLQSTTTYLRLHVKRYGGKPGDQGHAAIHDVTEQLVASIDETLYRWDSFCFRHYFGGQEKYDFLNRFK